MPRVRCACIPDPFVELAAEGRRECLPRGNRMRLRQPVKRLSSASDLVASNSIASRLRLFDLGKVFNRRMSRTVAGLIQRVTWPHYQRSLHPGFAGRIEFCHDVA
jgi:hypothetical protein